MTQPRIGLVGDYNSGIKAHVAIPTALKLAADTIQSAVDFTWIHTSTLNRDLDGVLSSYDGIWCVPGSPYENMDGALDAIRYARENKRAFLGTCGGFQHAVIEYARNVLGLNQADHAESNPLAELPLISPLSCSLVGARGLIRLKPGSKAATFYGLLETTESFHCNFGLTSKFRHFLDGGKLAVTGEDENGEPRVIELADHPFFLGTLFQPELTASTNVPHPLVVAFLKAANARAILKQQHDAEMRSDLTQASAN